VERLEAWVPAKKNLIPRMPVVSSVGEPSNMPELRQRSRQLVIWGSAVAKKEIYGRHYETVKAAVHAIGIERIVDVGHQWGGSPVQVAGIPVKTMGIMSPDELSKELVRSVLAVFSSNPNYLGKSSLYAAFCAHGVPALCLPTHSVEPKVWDGVFHGVHFITSLPVAETGGLNTLSQIAKKAREWYFEHRIGEHARVLAKLMTNGANTGYPGDNWRHAAPS